MKLKDMKKFCNTTPPFQSYRTRQKEQEKLENPYCPATPPPHPNHAQQAKTEPKKTENPYCPATHTSKVYKYTRTGPALYTAKTHTDEYVRDPARQKIPTSPTDPIKEDGT